MLLGIILILASSVAYNGSVVLLAVAARRHPGVSSLSVGKQGSGILGIALDVAGWVLEMFALALIPLTLARVLSVAGLGVLLLLTSWALKEPVGRGKIFGVVLIALGVVAVGFAPPRFGGASPTTWEWAVLLAITGPVVALPYALRAARVSGGFALGATASGMAYALSGIFTKDAADYLHAGISTILNNGAVFLPLALLGLGIAGSGFLAFDAQLKALRHVQASVVAPIVLALHTVVPIAAAPFLFDEAWPASPGLRILLASGILLTLIGTLVLSATSSERISP